MNNSGIHAYAFFLKEVVGVGGLNFACMHCLFFSWLLVGVLDGIYIGDWILL